MKLTKGKLTKLYNKKRQSMKNFKKKSKYSKGKKRTFRKKHHLDLNRKTLKNMPVFHFKMEAQSGGDINNYVKTLIKRANALWISSNDGRDKKAYNNFKTTMENAVSLIIEKGLNKDDYLNSYDSEFKSASEKIIREYPLLKKIEEKFKDAANDLRTNNTAEADKKLKEAFDFAEKNGLNINNNGMIRKIITNVENSYKGIDSLAFNENRKDFEAAIEKAKNNANQSNLQQQNPASAPAPTSLPDVNEPSVEPIVEPSVELSVEPIVEPSVDGIDSDSASASANEPIESQQSPPELASVPNTLPQNPSDVDESKTDDYEANNSRQNYNNYDDQTPPTPYVRENTEDTDFNEITQKFKKYLDEKIAAAVLASKNSDAPTNIKQPQIDDFEGIIKNQIDLQEQEEEKENNEGQEQ